MAAAVWAASALVLAAALLSSFRQAFAADVASLITANGPRVLFGAAVGGAFALGGAVRLVRGREALLGGLGGLALLAVSSGAAAGAFAAAERFAEPGGAWIAAVVGGVLGALLLLGAVRAIDRPSRWTNFAAAGILAAGVGLAALAGSYARARTDGIENVVAWLLGDLSGATVASGLALLFVVVVATVLAARDLAGGGSDARDSRLAAMSAVVLGIGIGAAGPLVFVASLVPRVVRWLSRDVPAPLFVTTCAVAGAATVAAVDAVPRLLVGGYDFPFNVPAAMVATPVFLVWNRVRLRAIVGPKGFVFEALEIGMIIGLVVIGAGLAMTLARVIAAAT